MGSFPDFDFKHAVLVNDPSGHVDEPFEDGRGLLMFKSSQITGKSPIKRISHHGPEDVEVNPDHERRRQGVEIKEGYQFGEFVFDMPSFSVCFQAFFQLQFSVVRDDKGRLFSAVILYDNLPQRMFTSP